MVRITCRKQSAFGGMELYKAVSQCKLNSMNLYANASKLLPMLELAQ